MSGYADRPIPLRSYAVIAAAFNVALAAGVAALKDDLPERLGPGDHDARMGLNVDPGALGQLPQAGQPPLGIAGHVFGQVNLGRSQAGRKLSDRLGPRAAPDHQPAAALVASTMTSDPGAAPGTRRTGIATPVEVSLWVSA